MTSGALSGIRIIDFGHFIAGPLTAMLLADQGADVIRVDKPGDGASSCVSDAYYNRGKRRISLDLKSAPDREAAQRLIRGADVVIENFRPGVMERLGVGPVASTSQSPRLIYCSLPGFAGDDPRAGIAAWEGVVLAATSGYRPLAAHCFIEQGEFLVDQPTRPLFSAIPLASNLAATSAAVHIVMALIDRERTGRGRRIEVPLAEAMIEPLSMFMEIPDFGGIYPGSTVGKYRCADLEYIDWCGVPPRFVAWLVDAVGEGDRWRSEGLLDFARAVKEPAFARTVRDRLGKLFLSKTSDEWEAIAVERSLPLVKVRTPLGWLECDHAMQSQSVVEVSDPLLGNTRMAGRAVDLLGTSGPIRPRELPDASRATLLAEIESGHDADLVASPAGKSPESGYKPLGGMTVIDLTTQVAGPTASRILADFGAEVIKVGAPSMPPGAHYINAGKRTIYLDVAGPEGQEIVRRLLNGADAVCQNFAMGWADRHGIGWEVVSSQRPDIVYASVSAFSYSGSWGPQRGYEMEGQAATGLARRYGGTDGWPLNQPLLVNDTGTGVLAAFAIGLGLFHRMRTGQGQHVKASLSQTATLHQASYLIAHAGKEWNEPSGLAPRGWSALQRLYQAEDRWLFVGASNAQAKLLAQTVLGQDGDRPAESDLAGDGGFAHELEKGFLRHASAQWAARLNAVGIGAYPVLVQTEVEDILTMRNKGLIEVERSPYGTVTKRPGSGFWSGPASTRPAQPSPFGSDAEAILDGIGLSDRMNELEAAAVIRIVARDSCG
ncbi:MAG TPA: CoA transferase [Allosphingosinicella sp.]|nr:CoA transferase [Allosphingosinicella sp.]